MPDTHYHRCPKHARTGPHNWNARSNPEIDIHDAECGGCIMLEVAWVNNSRLGVLDTLAEMLKHHAMLRERVTQLEGQLQLATGRPGHES